jgi:transcriptional regulator with XRE-family HTH domain
MARTSINQKLGKNLKRIRNEKGVTQERLQELSGLDRGYISGVERGVRNPSMRNVERLAKALKVSVSDLTNFQ